MNLQQSTVLITGGTKGIGLEFARQLYKQGATVIVTGRDRNKLVQTKNELPGVHIFQSDINNPSDIKALYEQVTMQFSDLNIIINNAGIMRSLELNDDSATIENVVDEIETNFSGTVRMTQQFLPHLKEKPTAAIVNITSGLAFIPFTISPIYCGTKAGVHIYSQALRQQLKDTSVKVFEVAPPKTNKPLQTALPEADNPRDMKVDDMVRRALKGITNDQYEIKPGLANVMKWMSRIAPAFFTNLINENIAKARAKSQEK